MAEILGWMIPLMQELGINASWEVIAGSPEFYRVTKSFHNGMQGLPASLKKGDFDLRLPGEWRKRGTTEPASGRGVCARSAAHLPAAFYSAGPGWAMDWRCRIHASHPNRPIWKYLEWALRTRPTIFSMAAFTRPLRCPMFLIMPSIDPLSEKNCSIPDAERLETLARLKIDPERPILLQVSRFDRFNNPLGVIEAYRLLKPYYPELQLVLAGGPADDDPEGAEVLGEVIERSEGDENLIVLMLPPDAHRTINILQARRRWFCRNR